MKRIYAGILTVLSFTAVGAFAQTAPATGAPVTGKTIQERKNNQQKRIAQGVKSGSLTPHETANLEKKEARINKEERKDRAANGGKLTTGEKAKINRQQNKVSKQIYNKKHNAKKRA